MWLASASVRGRVIQVISCLRCNIESDLAQANVIFAPPGGSAERERPSIRSRVQLAGSDTPRWQISIRSRAEAQTASGPWREDDRLKVVPRAISGRVLEYNSQSSPPLKASR